MNIDKARINRLYQSMSVNIMDLVRFTVKEKNKIYSFLIVLFLSFLFSFSIAKNNYLIIIGLIAVGIFLFFFENIDKTIYLLLLSILFLEWTATALSIIPRQFTWLPEFCSIVIFLYILYISSKYKEIPLRLPYLLVYIFICLTVIGISINEVRLPTALSGVRNHLKFIPFFILPFYFDFSDDFMKKIMKFILFFAFLQCPVAVVQRMVYKTTSGDVIVGTMGYGASGILSLFCISMIIFWTSYYFKFSLKTKTYVLGLVVLLIPMSLNETKITLFLIPITFLCVYFFIPEARFSLKGILFISIIALSLLSIYRVIYNNYYEGSASKIETYISNPETAINYLYHNKYMKNGELNRIPKVIFAYNNIAKDTKNFLFGVGPGNASDSFFPDSIGYYYRKYQGLGIDGVFLGYILWEYGLVGTLFFFFLVLFFFIKSLHMRKLKGIKGVISTGFLSFSIIIIVSVIYFGSFRYNIFGYLYWFLAGYLMNLIYYKKDQTDTDL